MKALHEAYLDRGEESPFARGSRARIRRPTATSASRPASTSATTSPSAAPRCSRTPRRSIPTGTGCDSPTSSCARSTRGRTTSSPARSSTPAWPTARSRTTSSPGCATGPRERADRGDADAAVPVPGLARRGRGLAADSGAAGSHGAHACVVTGGPDGDVKYWWRLEDGSCSRASSARSTSRLHADATRLGGDRSGRRSTRVGFMRGTIKMAGEHRRALAAAAAHELAGVPRAPRLRLTAY